MALSETEIWNHYLYLIKILLISWYDDIELFSYELIIFRNDYSLTFACLEPDPAIYLNNFGTSVVLL